MSKSTRHNWPRIWAIFATGVTAAFLVGKAPAALPALRVELGLTLFEAGLLVSMLTLVAGVAGVLIGALAENFGQRKTAIAGLVVAVGAGIGGAAATGPMLLLVMRAVEGIGFFLMSVSLPALIIRLADDRNRQAAMGLWGAYLPFGAGLVLLAGGLIISMSGWRGLWLGISAALGVMFLILWWAAPKRARQTASRPSPKILAMISDAFRSPGAVMLAVTFGCYSGQYLAVTSFVPLILVEQAGWSLPAAAAAGALVMLSNAVGNVAAGILLGRGVRRATLVLVAAVAMGVGAALVMSEQLSAAVRIASAVGFSTLGGLIPGALFAGVRLHAPTPEHVSTVNGLMLQGVSVGQLIGPALTTYLVTVGNSDWHWALAYLLPMALLTALAGLRLGQIEDRLPVIAKDASEAPR